MPPIHGSGNSSSSTIINRFLTFLRPVAASVPLPHVGKLLGEKAPPTLDKHFRRIEIAVKRITDMLDDVLMIGKGDAGMLDFKPAPLDLETFCQEILQEIQVTASPEHTLSFEITGQCNDIFADKDLLRHILTNLLANAVKYSPAGGQVHFTAICEIDSVTFRVQDEGLGIPKKDLPRLFEAFHRAANVGDISGTGLGLAIVKRSVEAHGGTISIESNVGVGTTFTVSVPNKLKPEKNNA